MVYTEERKGAMRRMARECGACGMYRVVYLLASGERLIHDTYRDDHVAWSLLQISCAPTIMDELYRRMVGMVLAFDV